MWRGADEPSPPVGLAGSHFGNQSNYGIGRRTGRVFPVGQPRFFTKNALDQAHAFYERYGGTE
ncbi:DedA family protein [Candidatus Aalborgicola defluviihabitans]|uniref:DedA family protein n=1 Tax=Candidatus Aalborgicola defluviihabitans TaxID=3386187 RepID=UPI0039B95ED2